MLTPPIDSFELLSGTGLASGMTLQQIRFLAECGKLETYADGDSLVTREDAKFDLLVLLDGKTEIRTAMNDVIDRPGPGSLIGEVSFLDQKPRSAKVVAVGECHVIRFPATLLDEIEVTRPDIAAKVLKNVGIVLCQRLRSTTRFAEASFV